jgi:hypothetical protein
MVKQPSTPKKRRSAGRPRGDPDDLRTERVAIRLHPDLTEEIALACRAVGLNRSIFVERVLIEWLTAHQHDLGTKPLDAIGRYVAEELLGQPRSVPGPTAGPSSMFSRIPSISSPATKRFAVGARRKPRALMRKDSKDE